MEEQNNSNWMPYEEVLLRRELENEALKRVYIENGLGWLVKFSTDMNEHWKNKEEEKDGTTE